jgi:O-antigen/teichoic acid export membrane protein/rubredoxin
LKTEYVRCKACGYIMRAGKVEDRCPACGAPKAAFEPYEDPMSARRRTLLKLDLHPVLVHFPVSLTSSVLVFLIVTAFLSGRAHAMLADTVKILVLLLPALVIVAAIGGVVDGRIRFRKIRKSLILKRKLLGASLLFVVSAAQTIVLWVAGLGGGAIAAAAALGAVGLGIIIVLAVMGRDIRVAAFPGD